jgi:hypothetical protein
VEISGALVRPNKLMPMPATSSNNGHVALGNNKSHFYFTNSTANSAL